MCCTVGKESSSATNGSSVASVAGKKRLPAIPWAPAVPTIDASAAASDTTSAMCFERMGVLLVCESRSRLRERSGGGGRRRATAIGTQGAGGRAERGEVRARVGRPRRPDHDGGAVAEDGGRVRGAGCEHAGGGRTRIGEMVDGMGGAVDGDDRRQQDERDGQAPARGARRHGHRGGEQRRPRRCDRGDGPKLRDVENRRRRRGGRRADLGDRRPGVRAGRAGGGQERGGGDQRGDERAHHGRHCTAETRHLCYGFQERGEPYTMWGALWWT